MGQFRMPAGYLAAGPYDKAVTDCLGGTLLLEFASSHSIETSRKTKKDPQTDSLVGKVLL